MKNKCEEINNGRIGGSGVGSAFIGTFTFLDCLAMTKKYLGVQEENYG